MVRENFDIHFIIEKFPAILSALPVTLEITAVTLVLGWLLGLLVAWGKVSGSGWLKKFLRILTDIIRGIPTVVLLYIVYFGLPKLINVSNWSKISFVVLALMIELGTTSSEMFRSAYNSIQKGQLEAAHALGYTEVFPYHRSPGTGCHPPESGKRGALDYSGDSSCIHVGNLRYSWKSKTAGYQCQPCENL